MPGASLVSRIQHQHLPGSGQANIRILEKIWMKLSNFMRLMSHMDFWVYIGMDAWPPFILRSLPMGWWASSGLRALMHPASWLEVDLCNPHCRGREPVPISCFLTSTYSITYVPSQKNVGKNWTMALFIFDYRNLIIRLWVLCSSNVLAEQGSQPLVECGTLPKNQSTAKNIFKMY